MCNCRNVPIGDYCSKEKLHINWNGMTKKQVDTAPTWATALVEADCSGHRQTWWVDSVNSPTKMHLKGRSINSAPAEIPQGFEIVHIWQTM